MSRYSLLRRSIVDSLLLPVSTLGTGAAPAVVSSTGLPVLPLIEIVIDYARSLPQVTTLAGTGQFRSDLCEADLNGPMSLLPIYEGTVSAPISGGSGVLESVLIVDNLSHTIRRYGWSDGQLTTLITGSRYIAPSLAAAGTATGTAGAAAKKKIADQSVSVCRPFSGSFTYPRSLVWDPTSGVIIGSPSAGLDTKQPPPPPPPSPPAPASSGGSETTTTAPVPATTSTVKSIYARFYISDHACIRMFDTGSGVPSVIAGSPTVEGDADGAGSDSRFTCPSALLCTRDGSMLYTVDTWSQKLKSISLTAAAGSNRDQKTGGGEIYRVTTRCGTGHRKNLLHRTRIQKPKTGSGGGGGGGGGGGESGGDELNVQWKRPHSMIWDRAVTTKPETAMYVTSADVIRRWDMATKRVTTLKITSLPPGVDKFSVWGLDSTPDGHTLIISCSINHALFVIDTRSGRAGLLAGQPKSQGSEDGPLKGGGGGGGGRFSYPQSVCYLASENAIAVADTYNHRVRLITLPPNTDEYFTQCTVLTLNERCHN